ncbi:LuxR family transcriptional regulator [Streptomyces sp. WAC08241]|nr:LuxR family transcriptional regulator [Streptomyces sp. WAC08241]
MLTVLGLTGTHEAVYRAMRSRETWGKAELAAHLGLDTDEVGRALDALFELRLMRRSLGDDGDGGDGGDGEGDGDDGDAGALSAVGPQEGLQALLDRQHEELLRQQERILERQRVLGKMVRHLSDERTGREHADAERIIGLDAVQRRLARLADEAAREVLTFMPGGAQSAPALLAARRNDTRLLARGVVTRTIGLDVIRADGPTLEHARWLTDQGAEFRTVPSLPPRMILVDRAAALVPLDPADTRRGALYLTHPGVVASLLDLFDQVWNRSTPLGADTDAPPGGLTDTERDLLQLIGQGLTDEAAAARLHISPRTSRRMMAALMERLGARSRFEAGLRAAQRGWL